MSWITAAEFARRVGCTRGNVSLSIKSGRLSSKHVRRDARNTYISTDALPAWQYTARKPMLPSVWAADAEPKPDWQAIADRFNSYIDPAAWGPPPWTADQLQTLQTLLEMASDE